jgi:uncharacterized RDD family membrane protein YckC
MEEQESSIFPTRVVYAGFWRRFAAIVIDTLVLAIPTAIIHRLIGGSDLYSEIINAHHLSIGTIIGELISAMVDWLYMAIMESGSAQASVGKMAMGIIVTDTHGQRISFAKATGRYFAKYLSTITLLVGYFMMLWDDRNQTLHDKIAGTLIVKKQPQFI